MSIATSSSLMICWYRSAMSVNTSSKGMCCWAWPWQRYKRSVILRSSGLRLPGAEGTTYRRWGSACDDLLDFTDLCRVGQRRTAKFANFDVHCAFHNGCFR